MYPQFGNANPGEHNTCFMACLYIAGIEHRNSHPVSNKEQGDLFCSAGRQREPHPTQKKTGRGLGKSAGEWTGRVEISWEEMAAGVACMAIYGPAPGFKGRAFEFWVFNR